LAVIVKEDVQIKNIKMSDSKQSNECPDELDGAKVIRWAWSGDKPFGFLRYEGDSHDPIEIYGLAICHYRDSDTVYRFSCDKNWEVQQDGLYESVEDALTQLPDQYRLIVAKWLTK
jgi:hypothetical protein